MIAFASSLDQAGPMTHTAEDAALLLNSMAGFDAKDSTSLDVPAEDSRLQSSSKARLNNMKPSGRELKKSHYLIHA